MEQTKPFLWFKIPEFISQAMTLLRAGGVLSESSCGKVLKDLRILLADIQGSTGCVLSIGRLHRSLRRHLRLQGADDADILMLCGSVDDVLTWQGAYTARSTDALHELRRDSISALVKPVADMTGGASLAQSIVGTSDVRPTAQLVGSKRVPSRDCVRRFVDKLSHRLARRTAPPRQEFNVRCAAMYVELSVSTCSRDSAVKFQRKSDLSLDRWDCEDSDPALDAVRSHNSDKDDDSCRDARIILLPRFVAVDLLRHDSMRTTYLTQIAASNGDVVLATQDICEGQPRFTSRSAEMQARALAPGLFPLFDEAMALQHPTSKLLRRIFGDMLDFPPYLFRHYMRSALRERGVSARAIDALFGHWAMFQSPYGAMSVGELHCDLLEAQAAVDEIMKDDGWHDLWG